MCFCHGLPHLCIEMLLAADLGAGGPTIDFRMSEPDVIVSVGGDWAFETQWRLKNDVR